MYFFQGVKVQQRERKVDCIFFFFFFNKNGMSNSCLVEGYGNETIGDEN